MFETKSGIIFIAGLFFFALAFLANGLLPWLMYADMPIKTVEQMIDDQLDNPKRSWTIMTEFQDLYQRYPEAVKKHFGEPSRETLAAGLREGHKVYVAEACWHCHSQFIRPVANEEKRWGPVSKSWEYHNELQMPVLFGTRRVGPDLCRQGGIHGNDWHITHFFKPRWTARHSVMPEYPWFFDGTKTTKIMNDNGQFIEVEGPGDPNRRGIGIILYVQFLGSWLDNYPHYFDKAETP